MNQKRLKAQLIKHEGIRLKPYPCPAGRSTIGIGRNLDDKGITVDEAHFLLEGDIHESLMDLERLLPKFFSYPEQIQHVLIDMRINLGPGGFRSFKRMIVAVVHRDWTTMTEEMKASRWYGQVGRRGVDLVEMVQEVIE